MERLKNQLVFLEKKYSNDQELGKEVRKLIQKIKNEK